MCPCGSNLPLDECCGRYHRGTAPPTAEALMRARYSAYATRNVDFIVSTGPDADRSGIEAFAARARFVKLTVHSTERGTEADNKGFVTFGARFFEAGKLQELRERSHFARVHGRWRYTGGDAQLAAVALSRNDLCPCGSGEKAKRCHLA